MQKISLIKKIALTALALTTGLSIVLAQNAPATAQTQVSGNNQLEIILVSLMALLVFVIWLLGRVLFVLGKQLIEKNKTSKLLPMVIIISLLFVSQSLWAQDASTADSVKVVANYGGLSVSTFYLLISILIVEMIIIAFLSILIRRFSAELLPQKAILIKERKPSLWWSRLNKKLTRAIPLEKEADIMLDHNYDGIRELDNALPPWWKYGFYITIGVAIIYFFNFQVLGYGKNPTQEYNDEMARARIEKEIYEANNKDKIDENNVPMADASGLAQAKEIFTTKCFACHGKLGEGGAGPNLTDDYWLHKGSLNDIYHTIKNGYPEKGMQSWASVYSPKELSYLASYVKTLHGTKPPNPKAPQGDLYIDNSNATQGAKTDTSVTEKGEMSKSTTAETILK
jgi:cytochrome c oxidase cbb3-type subunit III